MIVPPSDGPMFKSDNLQYNMLGRWVDRLINQAHKIHYFYFCKVIKKYKNKLKGFLQRILQEIMKKSNTYLEHQMLGT